MGTVLEHPKDEGRTFKIPDCFNTELEQMLLGVALSENEALNHADQLRPEDFYYSSHQWVWSKLMEYRARGERCSPVTLAHLARERDDMEPSYLAKLVGAAGHVMNVQDMASTIRELAIRRDVIASAIKVATASNDSPLSGLIAEMTGAVESAGKKQGLKQMHNAGQVTELVLTDMRENVTPDSTGIHRLDKAMYGGLYPGKMYGLAARKKVGKTLMLGTISYNLNSMGCRHLFICGEMGEKEIHQRQIARALGIPFKHFLMGALPPEQRARMMADIEELATHSPRNVVYLDAPAIKFDDLKMAVQNAVLRHKIKGFMLDYWQLVQGGKAGQKTDHLDEVAQWIAWACKRYSIWNITTSQVNKEGSPRGGEGLLNACDQAYMLHREDITKPEAWLEMMDSRYTTYMNVGKDTEPSLMLHGHGPYYREVEFTEDAFANREETDGY